MKKYKNIITLVIVSIISITGCLYALKWHKIYQDNKLSTAIITDYIHELKREEFSNYISENPDAVIYFGITSDRNCRLFEEKFKDYILANSLSQNIVYVSLNDISGTNFTNDFDKAFNTVELRNQGKTLNEVPAVAIYINDKLVDFIDGTNLTVDSVSNLLLKNNIVGD